MKMDLFLRRHSGRGAGGLQLTKMDQGALWFSSEEGVCHLSRRPYLFLFVFCFSEASDRVIFQSCCCKHKTPVVCSLLLMITGDFLRLDGLAGTWFWLCILRSLLGIRAGSPARQRSLFTGWWPCDLGRGLGRMQGGDSCLQRSGKAGEWEESCGQFLAAPSHIPLGLQWKCFYCTRL